MISRLIKQFLKLSGGGGRAFLKLAGGGGKKDLKLEIQKNLAVRTFFSARTTNNTDVNNWVPAKQFGDS